MIAPVTPTQIRAKFRARGISIADWARTHGFDQQLTYCVLQGRVKAYRGESHRIAVALGIKAFSPDDDVSQQTLKAESQQMTSIIN